MTGNCLGALIETGRLIERYTPLSRSRIWELNTAYWEARGAAAFMQDAVPYVATNDGSLSTATAEVVAAYALGLEAPRRLTVLEIGPGSGIFAQAVDVRQGRPAIFLLMRCLWVKVQTAFACFI